MTVSLLAAEDIPQEIIAEHVGTGIDVKTLKKHFARELLIGKTKLLLTAQSRLVKDVQDPLSKGGTRAAIYLAEKLGSQAARLRGRVDPQKKPGEIGATAGIQMDPATGEANVTFTLDIGEAIPAEESDAAAG